MSYCVVPNKQMQKKLFLREIFAWFDTFKEKKDLKALRSFLFFMKDSQMFEQSLKNSVKNAIKSFKRYFKQIFNETLKGF